PRARTVAMPAAAKFTHDVAQRPCDKLLGVVDDRVLERDPRLRQACHVDGQYQRFHCTVLQPSRASNSCSMLPGMVRGCPEAGSDHAFDKTRTLLFSPRPRRVAPPGFRDY